MPMIVRWPGVVPAGTDLRRAGHQPRPAIPTILEAAGAEGDAAHNAAVDGVPITPLLRDPTPPSTATALYWHYPHYHPGGATPYSAVRADDWRLVEFFEDGHVELYDLDADPAEMHDLASSMPDRAAELRRLLDDWRDSVGAQPPRPNPDASD